VYNYTLSTPFFRRGEGCWGLEEGWEGGIWQQVHEGHKIKRRRMQELISFLVVQL
jgi:hypothetical protein